MLLMKDLQYALILTRVVYCFNLTEVTYRTVLWFMIQNYGEQLEMLAALISVQLP